MKFFITSNTNILKTSKTWNKLGVNFNYFVDDYNKIFISLNDSKITNLYDCFFNIIYLNDYLKLNINKIIKELINIPKKNKNKKFFFLLYLQLYDNFQIDKINKKKSLEIYKKLLNVELQNSTSEFISSSTEDFFNNRNQYYLRCPFSYSGLENIAINISSNMSKINSKPFKLVILDCDNTLWGGVLGEDGPEGIKYLEDGDGTVFYDVQNYLKALKNCGFLLSIASKNISSDVWNLMEKRKMALRKKDFLVPKINWDEKYLNVEKILNSLSLKEDDVLYVDDDELERKKIKQRFPKISLLKFNDLGNYLLQFTKNHRLQKFEVLKEDKKKYHQYKLREKYVNLKKKKNNLDEIYLQLKQKVSFENLNNSNISRAEQLFKKTNQFNFVGNRYNKADLKHKNQIFKVKLVRLEDKFGKHGLIGVIIYKKDFGKIYITDFLLSCRILSRKVEEYVIYRVLKENSSLEGFIGYNKLSKNIELISKFLEKDYFNLISKKNYPINNFIDADFIYKIKLNNSLKDASKFF